MSSIVISGDTSGSITLAAPAVSGSNTLTLPALTGTVLTTATVGTILQMVQGTTTTGTSTTSASFVATALTASITPTKSTSKVLIQVTGPIDSAATNSQANGTIYRGGTNLGGAPGFTNIFSNSGRVIGSLAMTYLDSPATTSSTTYTVYINGSNGSNITFPQGTNLATITLTEVAA